MLLKGHDMDGLVDDDELIFSRHSEIGNVLSYTQFRCRNARVRIIKGSYLPVWYSSW